MDTSVLLSLNSQVRQHVAQREKVADANAKWDLSAPKISDKEPRSTTALKNNTFILNSKNVEIKSKPSVTPLKERNAHQDSFFCISPSIDDDIVLSPGDSMEVSPPTFEAFLEGEGDGSAEAKPSPDKPIYLAPEEYSSFPEEATTTVTQEKTTPSPKNPPISPVREKMYEEEGGISPKKPSWALPASKAMQSPRSPAEYPAPRCISEERRIREDTLSQQAADHRSFDWIDHNRDGVIDRTEFQEFRQRAREVDSRCVSKSHSALFFV